MDYKLESILSRVSALTDNLDAVNIEIANLKEEATAIKSEIKSLLNEIHAY